MSVTRPTAAPEDAAETPADLQEAPNPTPPPTPTAPPGSGPGEFPGLEVPENAERDTSRQLRIVEALLFASATPLDDAALRARLPATADLPHLLDRLAEDYRGRGIVLAQVAGGWAFRTAPDLARDLRLEVPVPRKLSRAAVETLAIVAYHQPVTRAEIENIRGVATSRGTLDTLMETGWVRPGRRRQSPGKPLTWVTTAEFLDHFGLASLDTLPGVEELRAAGLLDSRPAIATLPGGHVEDEDAMPTLPGIHDREEEASDTELGTGDGGAGDGGDDDRRYDQG